MAQRPQVRQFQAPTQADIRPAASPVETYIRPVVQAQAPSELTQFLSAISPAIEVEAEQRKVERLKKEREIANGIQRNKAAQLTAKKDELLGNLYLDYVKDKDASHAKTKEQIIAERSEYTDNYIGQLRESGVDENLITAFETEIMTGHSAFINDKWMLGKLDYEQTQQINELGAPIFAMNALAEAEDGVTLEQGKQRIHKYITDFKDANPDISWDRLNEGLMGLALADSVDRPNSPLIAWLGDAKLSKNQLNNPKYAETGATLRARQEKSVTLSKAELKQKSEDSYYQTAAGLYFDKEDTGLLAVDKEIELPNGVRMTPNSENQSTAIDGEYGTRMGELQVRMQTIATDQTLSDEQKIAKLQAIESQEINPLNQQYFDYYRATGQVPPKTTKAVMDFGLNITGDVTKPEVAEALQQSYTELDLYSKYGGDLKGKLGKEYDNFIAVQALVDNGIADISGAVAFIQQRPLDVEARVAVDGAAISDALDGSAWHQGLFTFTNKDEASNLGIMQDDVEKVMGILKQVSPNKDDDELLQEAITKVAANYASVKMPSGKHFLIKRSANSKVAKTAIEDIEQGMAQIMSDTDVVATIHNELGIEPRYVLDDGEVVSKSQLAQARAAGKFPVSVYTDQANFELELSTVEGNENLIYVQARSKIDGQLIPLTSINMNNYSKNKINILKDSYVTGVKGQITPELTGADELDRGKPVDTVFDIDTSQPEEVFAPVISSVEEATRLYGANVDRRTAEAGVRDFMEQQRNELLGRARVAMQNKGVEPKVADEASESMLDSLLDMLGFGAEASELDDITEDDVETISMSEPVQQPSETSDRNFSDKQVDIKTVEGADIQSKAANLIQVQEDFRANPYPDGKNKSVGYGFYLPSLEPDEKALIADVNNITEPEAKEVMKLKVSKITNFMTEQVDGFGNLPEKTQMAVISMGFQLGRENVRDEWPKFMTALRKAATLPIGSAQQQKALKQASTHMLYNVEGRKKTKTNWHKQTPNRANEMALALQGK